MRYTFLLVFIVFLACKNSDQGSSTTAADTLKTVPETLQVTDERDPKGLSPVYANERFKDVTVEKIGQDSFLIRGQGQIFESNFNWIVEDGHDELLKGYDMTDAGAPAWGHFEFGINVQKKRENSTLTLILFESSPQDGSRQYELPITLD